MSTVCAVCTVQTQTWHFYSTIPYSTVQYSAVWYVAPASTAPSLSLTLPRTAFSFEPSLLCCTYCTVQYIPQYVLYVTPAPGRFCRFGIESDRPVLYRLERDLNHPAGVRVRVRTYTQCCMFCTVHNCTHHGHRLRMMAPRRMPIWLFPF